MSSPIAFCAFDPDAYRRRVQGMSERELIEEGKKMRQLSGDGRIVSTTPSIFDQQLKICREEHRRRFPK